MTPAALFWRNRLKLRGSKPLSIHGNSCFWVDFPPSLWQITWVIVRMEA
jgi:hypothetical protein